MVMPAPTRKRIEEDLNIPLRLHDARKRGRDAMASIVVAEAINSRKLTAMEVLVGVGLSHAHASAIIKTMAAAYDDEMVVEYTAIFRPITVKAPQTKMQHAKKIARQLFVGWMIWLGMLHLIFFSVPFLVERLNDLARWGMEFIR